ncbi:Chain_A [Hexamita inflata]|uniref:Internalin-a n=1 Tax=Hexamita inflata TaxID=28002 RepID=A0AA86PHE0_9EUKA|nr:Chain A [Hexamita inflata]
MTEYKYNAQNEEYDDKMILKYKDKIQDDHLQIGDQFNADIEVTNLSFIGKLKIKSLNLYINKFQKFNFKNGTIQKLNILQSVADFDIYEEINLNVDDLQLDNLEILQFINDQNQNQLENDQLYNISKFKKLHTLDVSCNNVDLTHIHSVISLTVLTMRGCGLTNIDQIQSLVNLNDLDLSDNFGIDINPLCKITSLIKLNISDCNLKQIDQIGFLTNLEVLDISMNELLKIDSISQLINLKELDISENKNIQINSLSRLVGLAKLNLSCCGLRQLSALRSLINLQTLDISFNSNLNINELQYLKNLTHLNIQSCDVISICVLIPLVNLKYLNIIGNLIVHLDSNLDKMKQLEIFVLFDNRISDLSSLEKLQHYSIIKESMSDQRTPSAKELHCANKLKRIESPNIQLKEIQNKRTKFKTIINNLQQQINIVVNNARSNQIQFTSMVVCHFQKLQYLDNE